MGLVYDPIRPIFLLFGDRVSQQPRTVQCSSSPLFLGIPLLLPLSHTSMSTTLMDNMTQKPLSVIMNQVSNKEEEFQSKTWLPPEFWMKRGTHSEILWCAENIGALNLPALSVILPQPTARLVQLGLLEKKQKYIKDEKKEKFNPLCNEATVKVQDHYVAWHKSSDAQPVAAKASEDTATL